MAHVIIILVIIVGVIWAFVVFPSFRIVVATLIAVGIGLYFVASEQVAQEQKQEEVKKQQERAEFETRQQKYCESEQKRWKAVSASQIELRDPSLLPSFSGERYTLTASVKNNSKSKVTAVQLNVTALDCPTQDIRNTNCDVVGRRNETFYTDIPAGELRQINGRITLRDVPKRRGEVSSRFAVTGVRAAIDQSDDGDDLFGRWEYKCN